MPWSSSMSRTLDFMVFDAPQYDTKRGAVIHAGLILQRAAMLFNDAGGNRQTESRATLLGRKERIEQTLFHFRRDAVAGVGHLENHHVGFALGQTLVVQAGAQGHR